jgi:outer membrane lipoprotein-sorting protein
MNRFRRIQIVWLFLAVVPLSGCLFRTRKIERQFSTAPLKTATQQELLDYINTESAKIQSMQATVDIDTSVGDQKKGKITDYKQIRGYVLARKPAMLRMIGLYPIVRNTAFDMVSDGTDFKLWIPAKNKFVVGRNDTESHNPDQPLENLRPQHIYEALLLGAIDPQNEIAVRENDYETVVDSKGHRVEQPDYEVNVIRKSDKGWYLSRKVAFSRTDLLPRQQRIYDEQGNVATDARYENYKEYDGIKFPSRIEIERPSEGYDITLTIVKIELNKSLTNEQFALQQPPGAEVMRLDNKPSKGGSSGSPKYVHD